MKAQLLTGRSINTGLDDLNTDHIQFTKASVRTQLKLLIVQTNASLIEFL